MFELVVLHILINTISIYNYFINIVSNLVPYNISYHGLAMVITYIIISYKICYKCAQVTEHVSSQPGMQLAQPAGLAGRPAGWHSLAQSAGQSAGQAGRIGRPDSQYGRPG